MILLFKVEKNMLIENLTTLTAFVGFLEITLLVECLAGPFF